MLFLRDVMTPSLQGGGQLLADSGNGSHVLAGSLPSELVAPVRQNGVGRRHKATQCVARTADVSGMCPRVLRTDNNKVPIYRHFTEAL